MTPTQALAAATTTAAELLGMGDQLGRIQPGYLADLIAIDGDPTANLAALFTGVRWVARGGRVAIDRK